MQITCVMSSISHTEIRFKKPLQVHDGQWISLLVCLAIYQYKSVKSKIVLKQGIGCGSGGRVVASDTRGPQFESNRQQNYI